MFVYCRRETYYLSRAHSQSCYYCCYSFRKRIIMQSILCSMSLSNVVQKGRKTYRRRRDILRGVHVSDLFQKRPSWRGRAGAGPLCLSKREREKEERKKKEKGGKEKTKFARIIFSDFVKNAEKRCNFPKFLDFNFD